MAYLSNPSNYKWKDKTQIEVTCDLCKSSFYISYKSAEKNRKKNDGKHVCLTCKGQPLRPQNSPSYWDEFRKARQSSCIKTSVKYHMAIKDRDTSGERNGMFGKKLSNDSKKKMSESRKGKSGANATAWKGGKTSLTCRVKHFVYREGWYLKVYVRDNFRCCLCGSKKKIDAHHKESINLIIKRLCCGKIFNDENEKYNWLIRQKEILDNDLQNGITLCRECHRKAHNRKWGSHAS